MDKLFLGREAGALVINERNIEQDLDDYAKRVHPSQHAIANSKDPHDDKSARGRASMLGRDYAVKRVRKADVPSQEDIDALIAGGWAIARSHPALLVSAIACSLDNAKAPARPPPPRTKGERRINKDTCYDERLTTNV